MGTGSGKVQTMLRALALSKGAQSCAMATRWMPPERSVFQFLPFTHRVGAAGQQALSVAFHAEAGAEVEVTLGYRLAGAIEVGGAGVAHLGSTPAGPGQAVVFAVGGAASGLEADEVEGVPVLLLAFQSLGVVAGVADGPHAAVEFAGDAFDQGFLAFDLDVLEELVAEAELFAPLLEDGVVRQRLEQELDHLVPPLQGVVGGGQGAVGLELGRA